jgi:hypothetical protein
MATKWFTESSASGSSTLVKIVCNKYVFVNDAANTSAAYAVFRGEIHATLAFEFNGLEVST